MKPAGAVAAIALASAAILVWVITPHPSSRPEHRAHWNEPTPVTTNLPGRAGERVAVAPSSLPVGSSPIKSLLNITSPLHYGDFRWSEQGVPTGPVWVRIDLEHQLMSLFRSGHEIGTAVVLYGADAKPTPIGTFPIIAKLKDHRSAPYDAPMPYTLRLTPDGVSIHGSNVRWGAATHGCVGVPLAFAEKLFGEVALGTPVTIIAANSPAPRMRSSGA